MTCHKLNRKAALAIVASALVITFSLLLYFNRTEEKGIDAAGGPMVPGAFDNTSYVGAEHWVSRCAESSGLSERELAIEIAEAIADNNNVRSCSRVIVVCSNPIGRREVGRKISTFSGAALVGGAIGLCCRGEEFESLQFWRFVLSSYAVIPNSETYRNLQKLLGAESAQGDGDVRDVPSWPELRLNLALAQPFALSLYSRLAEECSPILANISISKSASLEPARRLAKAVILDRSKSEEVRSRLISRLGSSLLENVDYEAIVEVAKRAESDYLFFDLLRCARDLYSKRIWEAYSELFPVSPASRRKCLVSLVGRLLEGDSAQLQFATIVSREQDPDVLSLILVYAKNYGIGGEPLYIIGKQIVRWGDDESVEKFLELGQTAEQLSRLESELGKRLLQTTSTKTAARIQIALSEIRQAR